MASLLRRVFTSSLSLAKNYPMNAVIQNFQHQLHVSASMFQVNTIKTSLEDFIENRKNIDETIKIHEVENRFIDVMPHKKDARAAFRIDFCGFINSIRNDKDIALALNIIKKNKETILELSEKTLVIHFSKLLYALGKHDQLNDLINDKELGELFCLQQCTNILMLGYIEQGRYLEAAEAFLRYIKIHSTKSNISHRCSELFAGTIYLMNSTESLKIMLKAIEILVENNVDLRSNKINNPMLILCLKQNRPDLATKILKRTEHSVSLNFNVIINAQLNRIDKALEDLESIIYNPKNKSIFQDTLNHLKKAIEKNANSGEVHEKKFEELVSLINKRNLLNSQNLEKYIEIQISTPKQARNANQESSINKFSKYNSIQRLQSSNVYSQAFTDYENGKFNNVLIRFERLLCNLNSKITLPDQALDILSVSVKKDKKSSPTQIKRIIELIKEKTNSKWSINSQIDIFLKAAEFDPIFSLEFLSENDDDLKIFFPCIHKNLMCIGLSLIDQVDISLSQFESILKTDIDREELKGLIFPRTIEIMRSVMKNSTDNDFKNRFIDILIQISYERRLLSFDLRKLNLTSRLKKQKSDANNLQ